MIAIRTHELPVSPALLAWVLSQSRETAPIKRSATGDAWHSVKYEAQAPFDRAPLFVRIAVAVAQGDEPRPIIAVKWWANVLRDGAVYERHKHDGQWTFVYHLTAGAPLQIGARTGHFLLDEDEPAPLIEASMPAVPGQLLVFAADVPHWIEKVHGEPRVSIAGNLYTERRT